VTSSEQQQRHPQNRNRHIQAMDTEVSSDRAFQAGIALPGVLVNNATPAKGKIALF
jgi:hypothetical protein